MSRITRLKEQYQQFKAGDYYGWHSYNTLPSRGLLSFAAIDYADPIPIRRAKILNEITGEMPVFIKPEEVIVGHLMEHGLNHHAYPLYLSPEEERELYQTYPVNHIIADYAKLLRLGLRGIQAQAVERLQGEDDAEKRTFLEAVGLSCEAGITLARRYADEARRLAHDEIDPVRKAELAAIADCCRHVPAFPARTFREALQSLWFSVLLQYTENTALNQEAYSPGRFDQYMLPFYTADLVAGRLNHDEALELIEILYIKYAELATMGGELLTIGGMTVDGGDAVNDLSYLCLQAIDDLRIHAPKVMARISPSTPIDFMRACVETLESGTGSPGFFNDEAALLTLTRSDVPVEEARDYALLGCWEIDLAGKEYGHYMCCEVNLGTCLELALSNGDGLMEDSRKGIATGPLSSLTSFEELFAAYGRQVEAYFARVAQQMEDWERMVARSSPSPFLSGIIDGCIEQGVDVSSGGARYNCTGSMMLGPATVADSLLVIKRLVFEEREMTLAELVEVLRVNFAGHEALRTRLINQFPKYGNDDDEVDLLMARLVGQFCETVNRRPNWRGGMHHAGLYNWEGSWPRLETSALPDGTLAKHPLSMHICPSAGQARNGPTAAVLSAAKLDYLPARDGAAFSLTVSPDSLRSEADREKMAALIRTLFAAGGMHVQFNVVDADALCDAREHPACHQDLVVRVSGYSSRFVELPGEIQELVIGRTG